MPGSDHSHLLLLLGGISIFMFGMSLASDYLQRLASNRLRELMGKLSGRPFIAVVVGIFMTILMQSSGAVTSMLVNLGSAGVITLSQVMGVIIGSAVGSTLTVQLISTPIIQYGLGIFAFSFSVFFVTKNRVLKQLLGVAMGFGLTFFGLELMGMATKALKEYTLLVQLFEVLRSDHMWSFVVATVFTAFVHSSSVTLGLAMTLASSGMLDMGDAIYWIYGANVGTTSTALLAAVGGNYVGRQVAWSHFFYKIGSVALFVLFSGLFVEWLVQLEPGPLPRSIANGHTLFNLISALVFFPFIGVGARLMEKMFQPTAKEKAFSTKYINTLPNENPNVAYALACRETQRMMDIVKGMVRESIELFRADNPGLSSDLQDRDNRVDLLFRELRKYLVDFTHRPDHFGQDSFELISMIADLESAADIVDKNISRLAEKKNYLKVEFSPQGWDEIQKFHQRVLELLTLAETGFQLRDPVVAHQVIEKKRALRELEMESRRHHLERLGSGLKESMNTSSIHLEVLSEYRRVASLFANFSYTLTRSNGVDKGDKKTE